jgi:hypothetical protein
VTRYPPGAERALDEQDAEREAYNAWEQMAEASDALGKLTDIMATAAWEALNWPDGARGKPLGLRGPALESVRTAVRAWLDKQDNLYDWEVAHGLIPSLEEWTQAPERDGDAERDVRIAAARMPRVPPVESPPTE